MVRGGQALLVANESATRDCAVESAYSGIPSDVNQWN